MALPEWKGEVVWAGKWWSALLEREGGEPGFKSGKAVICNESYCYGREDSDKNFRDIEPCQSSENNYSKTPAPD